MTAHAQLDCTDREAATRSVALLEARIASIPSALARALEVELPHVGRTPRTVVTTGIGASEGPARLLASALAEAGVAARYVPLTTFALAAPASDLLVLFSQNLSPNARLALAAQHRFGARWLVTSAGYEPGASKQESLMHRYRGEGVVPILVPPGEEDGMLLRVVGPAVASLMALRIAARLSGDACSLPRAEDAVGAYRKPAIVEPLGGQPIALVAAGVSLESLHGHRWKLLETLLREDPPVWDVLQVAHGPLQAIHDRPTTLLVFSTPRAAPLVSRLRAALASGHHRVWQWASRHDDALAYFEHAAALDACLLTTLRARPCDLFHWPGRGGDGPLYDLGSEDDRG